MTAPGPPPGAPAVSFGQALGEAARHVSALHNRLLDSEGSNFLEWVVLNLVSASDGPARTADLCQRLTGELSIDELPVREVIDTLETAERLQLDKVEGEEVARLTGTGRAYHQHLRERVGQGSAALLAPFDPAEIAATIRVLVAVKERAPAISAT